jgi:hypothetical protein
MYMAMAAGDASLTKEACCAALQYTLLLHYENIYDCCCMPTTWEGSELLPPADAKYT